MDGRSHRSTQISLAAIGVMALLGFAGLYYLADQARSPAATPAPTATGAAGGPAATDPEAAARATLNASIPAADAYHRANGTYAGIDQTELGGPQTFAVVGPSTGPTVLSYAADGSTFTAAVLGQQTCWYIRRTPDTTRYNQRPSLEGCAAAIPPSDGWTDQAPVEPNPPSPR